MAGKPAPAPVDNHAPLATRDLGGAYWCSIEDSGFKYPQFPCAIRKVDNRFVLAKLGGSQRFEGEIAPIASGGFTFTGRFYCPYGDCSQALHGTFEPVAGGGLRGKFSDSQMIVRLVTAPDAAFGGAGYGGAGYGGAGYGGAIYGGNRQP